MADDATPSPPPAPSPSGPRRRHSGSETRQATSFITFRVLPADRASAEARADAAGQTLGAYMRGLLQAAPLMRSRRRPSLAAEVLNRILAELKREGNNINQLARYANMANLPEAGELRGLQERHDMVIAVVLELLGRGPGAEPAT